jgi:hypothetical protein
MDGWGKRKMVEWANPDIIKTRRQKRKMKMERGDMCPIISRQ